MERILISDYIKDGLLKVRVKPNSNKTEITGYDKAREAVKISLAAPPDKGKANQELLKFLKKELGCRVEIKSGLTSREKTIKTASS